MSRNFSSAILVFLCLLGKPPIVCAQAIKPLVYTTASKLSTAKIKTETAELSVRGNGTLTINAANEDDTITVTFVFAIANDGRQKIADVLGKTLAAIPTTIVKKNLVAHFQRGTACPVIHLEIGLLDAEVAGAQVQFNRLVFNVNETPDELTQLFCNWSRQINAKRHRRGIIAAINRLIVGEPTESATPPK